MKLHDVPLADVLDELRQSTALRAKQDVQAIARTLGASAGAIRNGDDAAAIPDAAGYTLLAAEGMAASFVASEPFFAGVCAVLTNVSDIAAMGGRAQAIVDVLFAGPDTEQTEQILAGLAQGSQIFGVPLVGGHTGKSAQQPYLCAAIVGRAQRLITSFDLTPGDRIIACVDVRGRFRGDTTNFDAFSDRAPSQVRAQLELLPELAEADLVHAGKDISMAGLIGTLLMLLETSGCGAELRLDAVPSPRACTDDPIRWLEAFPSFGYLLACRPDACDRVLARCERYGVSAAVIADATEGSALHVSCGDQRLRHWDWAQTPVLGFAPRSSHA